MTNKLHNERAQTILDAANCAAEGDMIGGEAIIRERWPHRHTAKTKRSNTKRDRLKRFMADGFVCRYSGQRLIFLPLLELLSTLWPENFPWHQNWRSDVTHDAFWTHSASLDHIDPVSIGGEEGYENWATTSAARNMVRSRFSLEGLGWSANVGRPEHGWDGGVSVYMKLMERYGAKVDAPRARHFAEWQKIVREVSAGV